MNENPDYITVEKARNGFHWLVVWRRYLVHEDSYTIHKCDGQPTKPHADSVAERWASDNGVELRRN